MEKQKHCDLILGHLKTFGSINPKEAENLYGCMRLAARIKDLRNRGVAIDTEIVKGKDRNGGNTRYAVYKLAKEGEV